MNDKITIAITAFRRPELLRRALNSAITTGFEVVCATGDNDASVIAVLEEYGIRADIYNRSDRGCNATWLAATKLVKTPLMVLLHDDDELLPNFAEVVNKNIAVALEGYQVIWNSYVRTEGKSDWILYAIHGTCGARKTSELMEHLLQQERSLSPIHGLWHTEHVLSVLQECEGLKLPALMVRPKMMVGNDLLLWLRAMESRKGIIYVSIPAVICHAHEGSETIASIADKRKMAKLHNAYATMKRYFMGLETGMKPQLTGVTGVIIESQNIDIAAKVLTHCSHLVTFDEVKLLAPHRPTVSFTGEFIQIPVFNYIGYSTFSTKCLWRYIDTSHALVMQLDGFIIHPELWDPDWMQYDYIGAPWPKESLLPFAKPTWRVGNSGFSLRSKRFMQLCGELEVEHNNEKDKEGVKRSIETDECADDVWMCQRPEVVTKLLKAGMRYAPVRVAMKFSLEGFIPECSTNAESFGFHDFKSGRTRYQQFIVGPWPTKHKKIMSPYTVNQDGVVFGTV